MDPQSGNAPVDAGGLLDASPVAAWVNCEDRIVYANAAAALLFGAAAPAEMIGKTPAAFIHPDCHALMRERVARTLAGDRLPPLEKPVIRLDGTRADVQVSAARIRWDGRDAVLATFADTSQLRAAQQRCRDILDTALEGAWIADLEGRTEFVNQRLAAMVGIPHGELAGRTIFEFLFPEDHEAMRLHLQRSSHGTAEQCDFRLRRRDGTELPVAVSSTPIRDAAGNSVTGTLAMVTDITARKRLEEALRDSAARYSNLAEAVPGVLFTNLPDGRSDFVNRGFLDFTGMTREQALGSGWMEALDPADRDSVAAQWSECLATGRDFEAVYRLRRFDGAFRRFRGRSAAARDEDGRIVRWFGVAMEVEEHLRAEEALSRSENRFRRLFDSNVVGVISGDRERITDANGAFLTMTGYSRRELDEGSLRWRAMTPPEWAAFDDRCLEELPQRGSCPPYEKEFRRKDGARVPVLIAASLVESSPFEWICYVLDLSEHKRLERAVLARQQAESLGRLAGGVAHNVNNLLVGIMGNASFAADLLPLGHRVHPLLTEILDASEKAAQLTGQLLAYAGVGRVAPEALDVSAMVGDMLQLLRSTTPRKIGLDLNLEAGLPPVVADAGQMRQLVLNLAANAAEAIGDREGRIGISTRLEELDADTIQTFFPAQALSPGAYLVLEVRDNGCGMDEQTKSRIFDPFFSTKFTGRGLGLAAVAGIVRVSRGAIQVYSSPGKGSTFQIFLPAEQRRETRPAPAPEMRETAPPGAAILVVDDEEIVIRTTRTILERAGYTVLSARDGREGVELFQANARSVALVLLDVAMPGMSGGEVLDRVQALRPDVKVLVSSGFEETGVLREFAGKRIAGLIPKPYTPTKLVEAIAQILRPPK